MHAAGTPGPSLVSLVRREGDVMQELDTLAASVATYGSLEDAEKDAMRQRS